MVKTNYSVKTGIWKSIKNVFLVAGVPAIVLLADNWTQWVPDNWNAVAAPVIGLIVYFIKNYIQNK